MVGNSLRGQEKSKCLFFVLAMAEKEKLLQTHLSSQSGVA